MSGYHKQYLCALALLVIVPSAMACTAGKLTLPSVFASSVLIYLFRIACVRTTSFPTFFKSDPPLPPWHAKTIQLHQPNNIYSSLPSSLSSAGSLDLDLVLTTGTGASSHPIAKCYSSLSVTMTVGCTLSVIANGQDNYVPSLFSAGSAGYTQLGSCPAGATVTTATDSTVSANDVATLIATSIYSSGLTATATATDASGIVTIVSGDATLKFRASSASGSTGIFTVATVACAEATECAAAVDGCAAGRFSVPISGTSKYVCGLCAAGTYSAAQATSCLACSGGSAAPAVGGISTDCAACSAGTFSTAGSSDCRPCEPGM
jgi:hypothetical protein